MSPYNAPAPLTIPTYDGSGHAIHPGVVVLDTPLGGYRYWMGFTPYPTGQDSLENPSIVASNDGLSWEVPPGLTNPLDPIPGDPSMVDGIRYNSDTDLVFHAGTLFLFWRRHDQSSESRGTTIYFRTSTDGVSWTPRQVALTSASAGRILLSPSVLRGPDGTWHMWFGDGNPSTVRHASAPSPAGPWTSALPCEVRGLESFRHVWHLDILEWDGIYLGLFATTKSGTTNISGALFAAVSRDGVIWQVGRCLIQSHRPAPGFTGAWDGRTIYRSSGVVEGTKLRLWYATDRAIGYTEVPTREFDSALQALRY